MDDVGMEVVYPQIYSRDFDDLICTIITPVPFTLLLDYRSNNFLNSMCWAEETSPKARKIHETVQICGENVRTYQLTGSVDPRRPAYE
jgi:hypothetical protein